MKNLVQDVNKYGSEIASHPGEKTFRLDTPEAPTLVKAFALPNRFIDSKHQIQPKHVRGANLPISSAVVRWTQLSVAPERTQTELDLSDHAWLLAQRPFVEGEDLREISNLGSDWRRYALYIALALRDLHEAGTVHGDFNPGNILIDRDGRVRLIDIPVLPKLPGDPGYIAGSAPFMAPERWEHKKLTLPSDIYAFARLICWMARGKKHDAQCDNLSDWAMVHTRNKWSIPETLDGKLGGIIKRTLDASPDTRPSIQTFIDHLRTSTFDVSAGPASPFPTEIEHKSQTAVEALNSDNHRVIWLPENLAVQANYFRDSLLYKTNRKLELAGYNIYQAGTSASEDDRDRRELYIEMESDEHRILDQLDSAARTEASEQFIINETLRGESRQDIGIELGFIPDESDWNRWRNNTLRIDARDIPVGRWNQILEQHLDAPQALLDTLNKELTGETSPDSDNAEIQSYLSKLTSLRANNDYGSILDEAQLRDSGIEFGRENLDLRRSYLDTLVDAMLHSGRDPQQFERLTEKVSEYLSQHGPDKQLAEKLFQLLHARKLQGQGLDIIDELEPSAEGNAPLYWWLQSWRAQFLLSASQFEEAEAVASEGLDSLPDSEEQAENRLLLELIQTAIAAIRADEEAIEKLEHLAHQMGQAGIFPSTIARAHSYRAMGLSRLDRHEDARDAHERALQLCEEAGLVIELPTYLLNLGTAYHAQGQLGLAREYYARGVRTPTKLVRPSTRALLIANQANIDRSLGRLHEAESLVEQAHELAESHDIQHVLTMCASIRGDIHADRGESETALESYRQPLDSATLDPTEVDETEAHLHLCETLLDLQQYGDAQQHLEEARRLIREHDINDLRHYAQTLRARLEWNRHGRMGLMGGIEKFRKALVDAHQAGNHLFVIEQSPHLCEKLQAEELTETQREIAELIDDAKGAIATGLTKELREDFYGYAPETSTPDQQQGSDVKKNDRSDPTSSQSVERDQQLIDKFYRMLSLNEIILQCDSLEGLWPRALDVGLTLSGAQRAFILLYREDNDENPYEIVASQDVESNEIPEPHLEVSLTIAQEAAETGQTVITVNATDDDRFNTALSVVDLELTSVLCVPIQNSEGLLGALYLDHQFESGLFEGEVQRMMEAYGHQLAVEISAIRRRARLEKTEQRLRELLEERENKLEEAKQRAENLTKQIERQRTEQSTASEFPDIAYTSAPMEQLMNQVLRIATSDISVVIQGESGVGKELIARALHKKSTKSEESFVTLNCGAVSESIFESELFGHQEGAFTGANRDKAGIFQAASGGTLFLDEIGETPLSMQVKLLRALQEQQVRPVGASETIDVDVRVVAATNRDLESMVEEGDFREDLYYRLATLVLDVPPLRDRPEDVPIIAKFLLDQINRAQDSDLSLEPEAARFLSDLPWPGNIRELENTLRAAAALTTEETIDPDTVEPLVSDQSSTGPVSRPQPGSSNQTQHKVTPGRYRKATKRDVQDALEAADGNRKKAAEILGVSRRTIYRYLDDYGLRD